MIRRGDVVLVAAPGDYGKPRPAVVLQSDVASDLDSVVLCLLTTELTPPPFVFRLSVEPTSGNGLRQTSQVMIDKILTMPLRKVREPVGSLTPAQMLAISATLTALLGLGASP